MFYRFNAHRAKKPQISESNTDRLAKKIASSIHTVQMRWAGLMDRHARKIPTRWLKAIVIVLALHAGSYCVYLIRDGMFSQMRWPAPDLRRLWPFDPYQRKERLQKQSGLDSLQQKVKQDSLHYFRYYQKP